MPAILRVIACFAIFSFRLFRRPLLRPSGRFSRGRLFGLLRRRGRQRLAQQRDALVHLPHKTVDARPRFFPVTASARKPFGQLHARQFGIQLPDALFERTFLGAERVALCGQLRTKVRQPLEVVDQLPHAGFDVRYTLLSAMTFG